MLLSSLPRYRSFSFAISCSRFSKNPTFRVFISTPFYTSSYCNLQPPTLLRAKSNSPLRMYFTGPVWQTLLADSSWNFKTPWFWWHQPFWLSLLIYLPQSPCTYPSFSAHAPTLTPLKTLTTSLFSPCIHFSNTFKWQNTQYLLPYPPSDKTNKKWLHILYVKTDCETITRD